MILERARVSTMSFSQWRNSQQKLSRLECDLLIAHVTQMSRAQILARPEQSLSRDQLLQLDSFSTALESDTPLAYVLGEKEFFGLLLQVNAAVLVPRPETELLVELALQRLEPGHSVLDAGTGSGAIAIALAHSCQELTVVACDNSEDALGVAAENARRHKTQIDFYRSDWFEQLPSTRWDVVVSNPPYIAANDPHLVSLKAEPSSALIADDDGMADLNTLIEQSPNFLNAGGWLMVEHGYDQAESVRAAMIKRGFKEVHSATDLGGIERVTQGRYCE
jgi:release factor glutamine methyltransferase